MNNRMRTYRRSKRDVAQGRRGAVTVLVLICLLVVVSLVGTMLQSAQQARRQLHTERDFRQAELLLQAGLERAAYRLASEQNYRGESWEPASQLLANRGRVVIEAQPSSDGDKWDLNVVAEFPVGSPRSVRRSDSFQYTPSDPRVEE